MVSLYGTTVEIDYSLSRKRFKNRAASIITYTGSDQFTPYPPFLETLGWKTVKELYRQDLTILKIRQDSSSAHMKELLCPSVENKDRY